MYQHYFGFNEYPFSIVPNSRFLYQSRRHKEALFQLQAGLSEGGGFAMLTGEVGTGKTTIAKAILKGLTEQTKAGLILNPTFSNIELLEAICDEFDLEYSEGQFLKQLNQLIYQYLLKNHAQGIQTLLVIDEAQHLSADVLEQLRLLTNLETETQKLLKVLLIGQPELQQKLQMPTLRQLAQRITGRYHLLPLNVDETRDYIKFRLTLAGGSAELLSPPSIKHIAKQTQGIPRLINLVCDAVFKQAYSVGEKQPSLTLVKQVCDEVMSFQVSSFQPDHSQRVIAQPQSNWRNLTAICCGLVLAGAAYTVTPAFVSPWLQAKIEQQYPAVADVETYVEVFPSELRALLHQPKDVKDGIDELYKAWGYQASVLDLLCTDNSQSLFRCEQQSGTFEQILELNQPVLLTLSIEDQSSYVVLNQVTSKHVELLWNNQAVTLERKWLSSIWQGGYHRIWQKYWDATLKPGMNGSGVALLDLHLSQLLAMPSSGSEVFDQELKQKVELFQGWQTLTVDGIAGQQTLRLLEKLFQPNAPKLFSEKEPSNV